MYRVHDWAQVHRLYREGKAKAAIAEQLGMSRTTVIRLLRLPNLDWTSEDRGKEGIHEWIVLRTGQREGFLRPMDEFVDF